MGPSLRVCYYLSFYILGGCRCVILISYRSLGVPYHSWRITHAKHHASTGHMTQDQVFVPKTRSDLGLPPLDPAKEDLVGRSVTDEVKQELWEALGDSPISATLFAMSYLVGYYSLGAF
jgi:omega-6 fatty acid desaturase / acyl-lipid omega-6 desaturase (Delta-12 desaturase)